MPVTANAADQLTTDLRSLFRDSEARAARLKLLIQVSRDLASSEGDALDAAVGRAAQRAAMFAGYARGAVCDAAEPVAPDTLAIPFDALAERGQPGRRLEFRSPLNPGAIAGDDDAEALRLLVEMIEARLTVDLHRRKEAELRLRLEKREKALEQALAGLATAQERERAAISADLHDGVAQQVAALHRRLELLRLDLTEGGEAVDPLIQMARQAVADLRGVISGLRPTSLDDLGVVAALREEARRLEALGHATEVTARGLDRLPQALETLAFRIGQEALNNVAKHAPGASVRLDLSLDAAAGLLILTVQDSGGRPTTTLAEDGPRFGLEIMRERLAAVDGVLETTRLADGFRLRAVMPVVAA